MRHGGEIYSLDNLKYDFSVNINPLGPPPEVGRMLREALPSISRYPDPECSRLKKALSSALSIPEEYIICGNGASQLIFLALLAVSPRKVLLSAPCFSGYERAAAAVGARVEYHITGEANLFRLEEDFLEKLESDPEVDMAILCSPSNPVGSLIREELLWRIVETCRRRGIYLMMDECFIGFLKDGGERTARRMVGGWKEDGGDGGDRLMVLDAFTKKYALPGLRLGYLICSNARLMDRIKQLQPEWSVSAVAEEAGLACLEAAEDYSVRSRDLIGRERRYLEEVMDSLSIVHYEGYGNYVFFRTEKEIFRPLLERGILIRHCDNYVGLGRDYYRIAICAAEANRCLAEELKDILG